MSINPPCTYSWRCHDHKQTRTFGTAKVTMEQSAMKHRQRFPGHQMDLLETRVIYRMGWRDADQLSLVPAVKTLDDPPF